METTTQTTKDLIDRMKLVVPGGVNSNVRLEVADVFFERGEGAWLWDAEGRSYIDYVLGQGPAFLGHAHPDVLAKVQQSIANGTTFGAQSLIELVAAEGLVNTLGWPDMVRIGMTSTETVQAALRLARAATAREVFIRFRGHYHGWLDNVLLNSAEAFPQTSSLGQLTDSLAQSITIEWNDITVLESTLAENQGKIAAVIMEPMMLNAGAILPLAGYLESVRELCNEHNAVLIFDETITGFRLGPQGAVGRFGVTPDLAIYGKAVAGGYPASVLAGKKELMELFAAGVNHSGTFNSNVLSCAAIDAALEVMRVQSVHSKVEEVGTHLMKRLKDLFNSYELPVVVRGVPAAFHVAFDTDEPSTCYRDLLRIDSERYRKLTLHARTSGLWLTSRGIWYVSAAHSEETTEITIARLQEAIDGFLADEGG